MTKTENLRLWCKLMLFHTVHSVAPNNVVVKTAETDVLFIALANMEKLSAGTIVWLKSNFTPIIYLDM